MDRRSFLKHAGLVPIMGTVPRLVSAADEVTAEKADYTLRIGTGLVELAPDHIISTTLYNGQFPGPLLRFKEGQPVVVAIHNDTDRSELVHWHGQMIPSDVDGASEEGSPFVPAHGMRRISFVPKPSGFRFYHTHVVAGDDLNRGTYTGQAGPVYIEPQNNPGAYDREIFLVMKEFAPAFSRGGTWRWTCSPVRRQDAATDGDGRRRGGAGESQGVRSGLRAVRHQWPNAGTR
ncbi:MAG TPA: multicopper oxidase domain-containing protein [Stellaceae bacterium]|nr:multicopper oxidase domain-containing protein [Stellaceae bacterium]